MSALPTSSVVHNRLSIPFVVPILHCSVCYDVKTVSDGRSNTFLAVDGRFLQMSGMPSHVSGREQFLPKPSCGVHKRRQAFLDRATLLDHLFCRNNMPVQVAKKLMNVISQFPFLRAKGTYLRFYST